VPAQLTNVTGDSIPRLLDVQRLVGDQYDQRGDERLLWPIVFFTRAPDRRRVAPVDGSYDGRFRVALTRQDIEAVLPLRDGASHQNGAYRFSIERVQPMVGHVSIVARQSYARSVFNRRPRAWYTVYLRDRQASQAMNGNGYDLGNEISLVRVLPFAMGVSVGGDSGFTPTAMSIDFRGGTIDESDLVIVRSTEVGSVTRTLTIANFPIRDQ
jgi:hypothetical protein